ncbi:virulence protein RhuM/Fic/DOC family protein [Plebeiibacterium sediminum]|uniref:Type II toxin-antitoxin system death-on-curing family toxin n=1 Tax=Plebeiibacterium sediminum TaxID=2992112 RepID=A0AAE3SHA5_9BACT|nr:virulence protein RhuM/Fic/DOC family protein [Plebeiobacterium sediminum]MCW3789375.1 type II toxin-antitoxin system death-on-curing family toxin [Plebeiobacterium sediminum]
MDNKIEIYKTNTGTEINVKLEEDTIWLSQQQMAELFDKDVRTVNEHIKNIYDTQELHKDSTIRKFRIVRKEGKREVNRSIDHYNLDMIISVGYRVNSKRGTQFRQWATQRLKDYLVKGYAINEKRLTQKQQEVEYLKTGIRIVSRAFEEATNEQNKEVFQIFSKGLALLDDYDHEELDKVGTTKKEVVYPNKKDYLNLINNMYSEFESDVFAKPKDNSFDSSINQIRQGFGGIDLYQTIEEKAANLLYFITKNHSFVDGNKRIAAACFVFFLEQNDVLLKEDGQPIIDNNTLAALTLFIATSKTEESDIVKQLVISILNRNK